MTFDKNRQAFRIIPIANHILFERKKTVIEKKEVFGGLGDLNSESTNDGNARSFASNCVTASLSSQNPNS